MTPRRGDSLMSTKTDTNFASFSYTKSAGWSAPFPALDSHATVVFAFGGRGLESDPTPFQQLRDAFPASIIAGCSTSGEIFGDRLSDDSLSVAVMRFQRSRVSFASAPVRSNADSFAAGDAIGRQLSGIGLRGVIVFADGLNVNGTELVRGISSTLPPDVVVTGGLAGDGTAFKRTWVLRNGAAETGFVTAVGIYGDQVRIGHGCKGGWDVFGPERVVTRSAGNVLFELDGKPALEIYKKYLGERAAELPSSGLLFPLALRNQRGDARSLVRTILAVDEATQSMTFAGDIPQGSIGQLMRANFDWLVDAAGDSAADAAVGDAACRPLLTIAVSCVGRRLILNDRAEDEIEAVRAALPPGSPLVGFYSYGELSPSATGAACDLHNQTMTITTISED